MPSADTIVLLHRVAVLAASSTSSEPPAPRQRSATANEPPRRQRALAARALHCPEGADAPLARAGSSGALWRGAHKWVRHLCTGTGPTPRTSAPGLCARPSHICSGTRATPFTAAPGLATPRTSAPGLGPPLSHPHQDWDHSFAEFWSTVFAHRCSGVDASAGGAKLRAAASLQRLRSVMRAQLRVGSFSMAYQLPVQRICQCVCLRQKQALNRRDRTDSLHTCA
jgi:hypothetical protein